jgi:nucleoporin NUP82
VLLILFNGNDVHCRSVQIGQFYHASKSAAPVSKIEWHPWGEAGSTLMIMTVDGKLRYVFSCNQCDIPVIDCFIREYDISVDTEEPQQVLSFVPEKKSKSYLAEDTSERETASFALGKGRADWGPLTIYAVMKSGDVYSICPYMPKNA